MLAVRNSFLRAVTRVHSQRFKSDVQCTEIRIPVPYGHIAGKWWGPQDRRPILTLHGWQDNCGSFDLLIPMLPKHLSFLTLDFPGHGHSSKYPPGMFYLGIDGTIFIRHVQKYFNWKKISLMGHSMGGMMSYGYSYVYPEAVDFCICIDGFLTVIHPRLMDRVQRSIEEFVKYDEQFRSTSDSPTYSTEELERRLHLGSQKSIDLDKCKYILERNIRPAKETGKYYIDRDPRLKCGQLINFCFQDLLDAAQRIKFPFFLAKAKSSPFFDKKGYFLEVLEVLRRNSSDLQYFEVPGTHHMHLNNPEILKHIVSAFVEKHYIEDKSTGGLRKEMLL